MQSYIHIVRTILTNGIQKPNRTGTDTLGIVGHMFEHDMATGFPLLTTKKVPFHLVASELEFFIKGITDKQWLQERKNYIWNEWAAPEKVPYGHSTETKQRMLEERDLGPVYGFQWRHFGAQYVDHNTNYENQGKDQLRSLIQTLKTNPTDRRMLVVAWNPMDLEKMALPPCHYAFQVTVTNGKLNLLWNQRSVDVMLGLPFNIASYGLLLHLLAKETGLEEGKLIGFLADVHIYVNHITGAEDQIKRNPHQYTLPTLITEPFSSIFAWQSSDSQPINYISHPSIKFDIAI